MNWLATYLEQQGWAQSSQPLPQAITNPGPQWTVLEKPDPNGLVYCAVSPNEQLPQLADPGCLAVVYRVVDGPVVADVAPDSSRGHVEAGTTYSDSILHQGGML